MRYVTAVLCAVCLVCGCSSKDPQHAALDKFIDVYIHHADPAAARSFATGDALVKLEGEVAGVAGQERPTGLPEVDFKIIDERPHHDTITYQLELTIHSGGSGGFTRDLFITSAQIGSEWKVVDFVFLR